MLTFESSNNKSHEEATNRPENLTSSSENDQLEEDQSQVSVDSQSPQRVNNEVEKDQSQATAAAVPPHSKDVQLGQDCPQASTARHVKWKFPVSTTEWIPSNDSSDDANYGSVNSQENFKFQDSGSRPSHRPQCKNEQINYLNHRVDLIRTKL